MNWHSFPPQTRLSTGNATEPGLIASAMVTQADGYAEREAAKVMINDARQVVPEEKTAITLGADKGYDAKEFIDACIEMTVIPHVAQNTSD